MKVARTYAITVGLLAVALTSSTVGVTEVQAGPRAKTLPLFVALDPGTFAFTDASTTAQPVQGPFSVEGDIFDPDDPLFDPANPPGNAPQIGTFEGWGWILFDESGGVAKEKSSQVYSIGVDSDADGIPDTGVDVIGGPAPELGSIATQGLEFNEEIGLLAVVGGTDDFSNVSGDAVMTFTNGQFDVVFEFARGSFPASRAR